MLKYYEFEYKHIVTGKRKLPFSRKLKDEKNSYSCFHRIFAHSKEEATEKMNIYLNQKTEDNQNYLDDLTKEYKSNWINGTKLFGKIDVSYEIVGIFAKGYCKDMLTGNALEYLTVEQYTEVFNSIPKKKTS